MTGPDTLDSVFGPAWSEMPLFYAFELALRFELGSGSFWTDQHFSAMERARELVQTALGDATDTLLAIVRFGELTPPQATIVGVALETYGLPPLDAFASRGRPARSTEEDRVWEAVAPIDPEHVDRALWAAVGTHFGLLPQVPGAVYVVSPSRKILCHPYDDRGMDIVSQDRDLLEQLYRTHNEWLLDYDRDRMDRTFGPLPQDRDSTQGGVVVDIDGAEIVHWDAFHNVFLDRFGFPSFYGRNMDAWVDCMTYRDDDDGMSTVNVLPGETITIRVTGYEGLKERCPWIAEALNECAAAVNFRRVEAGKPPILILAYAP